MKIQQPKEREKRTKADFLFERANILSKQSAVKIGSNIKKKPTFWDKPWPKLVKLATFWNRSGTINPHITYPPLLANTAHFINTGLANTYCMYTFSGLFWFHLLLMCLLVISQHEAISFIKTSRWKYMCVKRTNIRERAKNSVKKDQYSPPQSRSFVHFLPLLPESRTSEQNDNYLNS